MAQNLQVLCPGPRLEVELQDGQASKSGTESFSLTQHSGNVQLQRYYGLLLAKFQLQVRSHKEQSS